MRFFAPFIVSVVLLGSAGCQVQQIQGGFQDVCKQLVAMGPLDRAANIGANGKHYEEAYGIYYDSVTDALYTKTATGERDYILKGDLIRATTLIDNRQK